MARLLINVKKPASGSNIRKIKFGENLEIEDVHSVNKNIAISSEHKCFTSIHMPKRPWNSKAMLNIDIITSLDQMSIYAIDKIKNQITLEYKIFM